MTKQKAEFHLRRDDLQWVNELCDELGTNPSALVHYLIGEVKDGKLAIDKSKVEKRQWRKLSDDQVKELHGAVAGKRVSREAAEGFAEKYGISYRYVKDFDYEEATRGIKLNGL